MTEMAGELVAFLFYSSWWVKTRSEKL